MNKPQFYKREVEIPQPIEQDKGGEVVFWGKDNLYPQWLNYLFYTCAIHQGIIRSKVMYTTSTGISGDEKIVNMFKDIIGDMSLNLEISNSYYLLVQYDLLTGTKIANIKFIPYEWVRVTKQGTYVVSEDWTDVKCPRKEYISYKDRVDEMLVIIPFQEKAMQYLYDPSLKKKVTLNYYSTVPYSGAITSIMTEIEIKNYSYSEVINTFSLGTIVSLNNGKPIEEKDRDEMIDYIVDGSTGSDNAGGVMVVFANGKDTEPTVLHLNGNQLHERYLSLSKDTQDNILRGHSVVTPQLFGFLNGGSFNQSDLDIGYFIMKENYFAVRQKQLLYAIRVVEEINGVVTQATFNEFSFPTSTTPNITSFKSVKKKEIDDNKFFEALNKLGRSKEGADIIFTCGYDEDIKEKMNFDVLSTMQNDVLKLVSEGQPFNAIVKALDGKIKDVTKAYQFLIKKGLITKTGQLTTDGKLQVVRRDASRMSIEYSYDVKPTYGAPIIPTTRPFCKTLIEMNRLWTIDEINSIKNEFGQDALIYRGGWYRNPNTDKNEPTCRHYWQQNIVFI